MKGIKDIEALLRRSGDLRAGITKEALQAWARASRIVVPDDQAEVLVLTNGARVPEGGLCSTDDIALRLDLKPEWREKRWLPVVEDGCGNVHVSVPLGERRVLAFADHEVSMRIAHIEASSVLHGVACLLEKDLGLRQDHWPFDKAQIQREDPDLIAIAHRFGLPLPWSDTDPEERRRMRRLRR